MFKKEHILIHTTADGDTCERCLSVLRQINTSKPVLKISFFVHPTTNEEYLSDNETMRSCVQCAFGTNTPLVSLIAQKPYDASLTAEVTLLDDPDATVERHERYIVLRCGGITELISEGILPKDNTLSTFEQAQDIFATIAEILDEEEMSVSDIYRQWNYIEGITTLNDGSQNYQEFNDARSIFYNTVEWERGYPAATGIGTGIGGVMIEFAAARAYAILNRPIDNPLQISAHNYSQEVLAENRAASLAEKTTPKFERARLMSSTIYISGTAAIRGEESIASDDAVAQAEATMEIMDTLVSKENIPTECCGTSYTSLRIYVKRESDIPGVKAYMEEHYPNVKKHYLVCDICRPELLLEIEGVAEVVR